MAINRTGKIDVVPGDTYVMDKLTVLALANRAHAFA